MAKIINGKDVGPMKDRSLAKDLITIVGVGLAAGTALVAGTNKVMTKLTEKKNEEIEADPKEALEANTEEIEEEI